MILAADYVYEDKAGNLWMLAYSPIVGLIKYDRQTERLLKYPVGPGAVGLVSSKLLNDGQNGFWVPSSLGLYYFDRQTEQLTLLFQQMRATRMASTITALCQFIGIGPACCGWARKMVGLIFSTSAKNSSAVTRIVPATPIVSRPGGSLRFIKTPMAFYG